MICTLFFALVMLSSVAICGYAAEPRTSDEIVTAFFKKIEAGAYENAFKTLFEESEMIKEKPQAIQTMIAQTSAAFSLYGKILSWEKIEEKPFGQSLKKTTYFMKTKYPVAWEFYFWKTEGRWSTIHVRFVDQVQLIFQ